MSKVQPKATNHHHDRTSDQEQSTASEQASPTSVEPVAPQDSHAQGAATAEQRNLLHANVSGSQQKGAAENAKEHHDSQPGGKSGLHSTGSHTGTTHGKYGAACRTLTKTCHPERQRRIGKAAGPA